MNDSIIKHSDNQSSVDRLLVDASRIIDQGRHLAASSLNATVSITYWNLGCLIDKEVLCESRAGYGSEIVSGLAAQLVKRYGRAYHARNLHRMVQFSRLIGEKEIVSTPWTQLSWSHIRELLPLESSEAREFYAQQVVEHRLSVRDLTGVIDRKVFERHTIADSRISTGSAIPQDTFKDPYLLDFLGLTGAYQESDLESAILAEMERFLLEVGYGFTFAARQKRMSLEDEDFYLDLLFFSRPLKRLVAVELKMGKFKAAYEGQMRLYLKWLDRFERQPDEEAPIGLILCTKASRAQIELMELDKEGIAVAEYWTELPPKEELEERIALILREAKERLARRELELPRLEG